MDGVAQDSDELATSRGSRAPRPGAAGADGDGPVGPTPEADNVVGMVIEYKVREDEVRLVRLVPLVDILDNP